ncbi:competence/damage-inducible protein A [Runella aurantiaca]|uniref:CinA-like protein n=1 Tax=Runella aurantiaca TaxID=2282308 RepID=A0A369IGX6_9BACT|nr:competence/damage-inducible protein A [Runella aurantiaca]RDB07607.1 competence/damage-inducible protein A [Runella aurantiaca]
MVKAEVITIGDEILFGQITDTNTQWISTELTNIGIRTIRKSSVGDDEKAILEILAEAESRADVILITGGLGPTKDDITKKTLCTYFDTELSINEEALAFITAFFEKRGRPMTELNRLQAAVPNNCTYIANRWGTAPGMWFERNGKVFISMPGVPFEMKNLMTHTLLPKLQAFFETPIIYHKMLRTIGIGESFLAERIADWEDNLPPHIKLAYLPNFGQVRLRLTATGTDLEQLKKETQAEVEKVLPLIDVNVFGYDNDEIETVVGRILKERGQTLSTAESCTGGYTSHLITKVSGSSAYFVGGIISYSNEIKIAELGVKPSTLAEFGAVSEQTVVEMAEGVRQRLNSTYGIAASGIAGPDGGTDEKPVGTIWIASAGPDGTVTQKLQLGKFREQNIQYTSVYLLNLLRKQLLGL